MTRISGVTVVSLKEGEEAVVRSIVGKESLTSRLAAMGIVSGATIKMLRNGTGPVILLASDTRLAWEGSRHPAYLFPK